HVLVSALAVVSAARLSIVIAPPLFSVKAPVTVSVPPVTLIVTVLVMPLWLSDRALAPLLLIVPLLLIADAPMPCVSCSVPPDSVIVAPELLVTAAVPVSVSVPLTVIWPPDWLVSAPPVLSVAPDPMLIVPALLIAAVPVSVSAPLTAIVAPELLVSAPE